MNERKKIRNGREPMKMIYNSTPIKSLNVRHFEMNTNDATMKPSDLQTGVTGFAKGKKVTGTGKSFEFANYGEYETNKNVYIPTNINVVQLVSLDYYTKMTVRVADTKNLNFNTAQVVGNIVVDDVEYPVSICVSGNFFIY